MSNVVDMAPIVERRRLVERAHEMLAELKTLIEETLKYAEELESYQLEQALSSVELVGEELDQVAADPEQPIHLTALTEWLRLARRLYTVQDQDALEHCSNDISGQVCNQEILNEPVAIYSLHPEWTDEQRNLARGIIVNHVTYAGDEWLKATLLGIGHPLP